MSFFGILITGIALAMDALAVSMCKGMSIRKVNLKVCLRIAFYFGICQSLMPVFGYLLGYSVVSFASKIGDLLSFILLFILGVNMITSSSNKDKINDDTSFRTLILLAFVTSIDAFIVGVTFVLLNVNILLAATTIFLITFTLCLLGVYIGNLVGAKYGLKTSILAGFIMIYLGLKSLVNFFK